MTILAIMMAMTIMIVLLLMMIIMIMMIDDWCCCSCCCCCCCCWWWWWWCWWWWNDGDDNWCWWWLRLRRWCLTMNSNIILLLTTTRGTVQVIARNTVCASGSVCTQAAEQGALCNRAIYKVDSRFAPSQWETALLCNDVSHWLGANLESALNIAHKGCYRSGPHVNLKILFTGVKIHIMKISYVNNVNP